MIIIGLGNKGLQYKNTYHNMGFDVADKLAKKLGVKFSHTECRAKTAVTNVNGRKIRELMGKYRETADGIVVIYDDIDIALGTLRARSSGSAGTHNGMRNIVDCLNGNTSFRRIRVGTGFDRGETPLYNVVLSKVKGDNKTLTDAATTFAADALYEYVKDGDWDRLMRTVDAYSPT